MHWIRFSEAGSTKKSPLFKGTLRYQGSKKVLLTITRMSNAEQYKGYDLVLEALSMMELEQRKKIYYIIAGRYDMEEYRRINDLIAKWKLESTVRIVGYVPSDELQDHYQLASLFLMPSKMEGFGIVLIESLASGTPVVAGNEDGSVEALQHGKLGTLVDPSDPRQLKNSIDRILHQQEQDANTRYTNHQMIFDLYNAPQYKKRLRNLVFE